MEFAPPRTRAAIASASEVVELPAAPDLAAVLVVTVDATFGVKLKTGAGKSGCGWPATLASIHRTTSPEE